MTQRILALLVPLALLAPLAVADADSHAPLAVASAVVEGMAFVVWTPGEVPADAYRVYGLGPGGSVLLHDTQYATAPGSFAQVPGGFASYAVTGIRDGVESSAVSSSTVGIDGCHGFFTIYTNPPGLSICKLPLPPKVQPPVVLGP